MILTEKALWGMIGLISTWAIVLSSRTNTKFKEVETKLERNKERNSEGRAKLYEQIREMSDSIDEKYARKDDIKRLENKIEKLEHYTGKRFDRVEDMLGDRLDKMIDNSFSNHN